MVKWCRVRCRSHNSTMDNGKEPGDRQRILRGMVKGQKGNGMDTVVLAAGLGTRLRPHTLQTPKPLLPVQGRPILDWTLGALPRQVERVLVVIHYLGEQVEKYLRGQSFFRQWQVVRQETPRGTGDALLTCQAHLRSEQFLALN